MKNIGIISAGPANYLSIFNAVKKTGSNAILINNNNIKTEISHLIIPGVGSFGPAIKEIKNKKLYDFILDHINLNKPLLGICVGYQMLFDKSEESIKTKGICYFNGSLKNLKKITNIVPNIGWHQTTFEKKIIKKLKLPYTKTSFYYAHSFYVDNFKKNEIVGFINLKKKIPVIANKDNVIGVQFHPEKSGSNGIKFLEAFVKLK